ncbi:MAG: hypothetical protein R3Y57_07560 [Erysipelotrichaceae bacterium]
MTNYIQLNPLTREAIEIGLVNRKSFKEIAEETGFHCTTLSKRWNNRCRKSME